MSGKTWLLLAAAVLVGCGGEEDRTAGAGGTTRPAAPAVRGPVVRKPAVAGTFYPGDKEALADEVDSLLAGAKSADLPNLRALVCPHAGYRYSGATAAAAYKQLRGRDVRTVIILAPSHFAMFNGISVPDVDAYETPLGQVSLSPEAKRLAWREPFVTNPPCRVQRAPWASDAAGPPDGKPTPHTWEHSLEVQLPFLQRVLGEFTLLPAVFGQADPAIAARVLAGVMTDKMVLIASSDLSHYKPYEEARLMDRKCIQAMLDLDIGKMGAQSACGKGPILTVMHLARLKGWKTRLLDYRNSGDTAGDKRAVVGYSAVAFYGVDKDTSAIYRPRAAPGAAGATFTDEQRAFLLAVARKRLAQAATEKWLPGLTVEGVPEALREARGCFVTLNKNGKLRGCIGYIFPVKPLYEAVADNTVNAALRDSRFPPVKADELAEINIEISVLTVPEKLAFSSPEDLLARLRPNVDGVVLRFGQRQATYLPQVWQQIPNREAFLGYLSAKAGMPSTAWRKEGMTVLTYQAEVFHEPEK